MDSATPPGRLLEAARDLFTYMGIANMPVREIRRDAQVTAAVICYRFGSKAGPFHVVAQDTPARMASASSFRSARPLWSLRESVLAACLLGMADSFVRSRAYPGVECDQEGIACCRVGLLVGGLRAKSGRAL